MKREHTSNETYPAFAKGQKVKFLTSGSTDSPTGKKIVEHEEGTIGVITKVQEFLHIRTGAPCIFLNVKIRKGEIALVEPDMIQIIQEAE